jgi:hypothetical protein
MRAFYAETLAGLPASQPIGTEPVKFWRAAFAARFHSAVPERSGTRRADVPHDRLCPHHPRCEDGHACIDRLIAEGRERRRQSG